jgi:hypothetical protein
MHHATRRCSRHARCVSSRQDAGAWPTRWTTWRRRRRRPPAWSATSRGLCCMRRQGRGRHVHRQAWRPHDRWNVSAASSARQRERRDTAGLCAVASTAATTAATTSAAVTISNIGHANECVIRNISLGQDAAHDDPEHTVHAVLPVHTIRAATSTTATTTARKREHVSRAGGVARRHTSDARSAPAARAEDRTRRAGRARACTSRHRRCHTARDARVRASAAIVSWRMRARPLCITCRRTHRHRSSASRSCGTSTTRRWSGCRSSDLDFTRALRRCRAHASHDGAPRCARSHSCRASRDVGPSHCARVVSCRGRRSDGRAAQYCEEQTPSRESSASSRDRSGSDRA